MIGHWGFGTPFWPHTLQFGAYLVEFWVINCISATQSHEMIIGVLTMDQAIAYAMSNHEGAILQASGNSLVQTSNLNFSWISLFESEMRLSSWQVVVFQSWLAPGKGRGRRLSSTGLKKNISTGTPEAWTARRIEVHTKALQSIRHLIVLDSAHCSRRHLYTSAALPGPSRLSTCRTTRFWLARPWGV